MNQNENKPQQYYIVSIKHTSKGDTALTLWGPNNAGYFWDKSMAGVYTEAQAAKFKGDENNIPVPMDAADSLFLPATDFGDKYTALPNNATTRTILGLSDRLMKEKKYANCRMKFHAPVNAAKEGGE